jgi:hypothetical protein
LDYFGARYMSAAQGRFTSPDQPGADWSLDDPHSWNLYSYVRNNPLSFVDPTGRKCVKLDGGGTGDDGQGPACEDKSLDTTHGVTVSGITGTVTPGVFGNAVLIGDIDLTGRKDFIIGYEAEDLMAARGMVRGLLQNPFRTGTTVVLDFAKRQRMNVRKPRLVTHPNRDPKSGRPNANKTPQPADAGQVFETAIPDPADPTGHKWWGKNASGDIYRFQGQNGEVHFNGAESSGVRVPSNIKEWLK